MLLSGVTKLTLLDFPGKTACIVFTAGCNFRCGFCHNPEFVLPEKIREIAKGFIKEEAFFNFLDRRKGLLQGVVITGGEPTLHPDLEAFIRNIRERGFAVKLDSNGNRPEVLARLLGEDLLDFVAMDYKTRLSDYRTVSGEWVESEKVRASRDMLIRGSIPYEFRTTLLREVHTPEVLGTMRDELAGATTFYLQPFRNEITLDPAYEHYSGFDRDELEEIAAYFRKVIPTVAIREV
jgi:pyruvate formate lyase activating enzyme